MTVPVHGKIRRWMIDPVLADTADIAQLGFWGRLRAEWKFVGVVAGAGLLTWQEWIEHHPPNMALIALIHFVFVWILVAIAVHIVRWLRSGRRSFRKNS